MRLKAFEYEVYQNQCMEEIFKKDPAGFQKVISRKRKPRSSRNKLEVDGKLITVDQELLSVWKDHYQSLYIYTQLSQQF